MSSDVIQGIAIGVVSNVLSWVARQLWDAVRNRGKTELSVSTTVALSSTAGAAVLVLVLPPWNWGPIAFGALAAGAVVGWFLANRRTGPATNPTRSWRKLGAVAAGVAVGIAIEAKRRRSTRHQHDNDN